MLASVKFKVVQRVLRGIIVLVVQGKSVQDHVCLLNRNTSIHPCVLINDAGSRVSRDEDVRGNVFKRCIGAQPKHLAEHVCIRQCVCDQRHGEASIIDTVCILIRIGHVRQNIRRAVFSNDFGVEGGYRIVNRKQ